MAATAAKFRAWCEVEAKAEADEDEDAKQVMFLASCLVSGKGATYASTVAPGKLQDIGVPEIGGYFSRGL